jgi:hypothetical protein
MAHKKYGVAASWSGSARVKRYQERAVRADGKKQCRDYKGYSKD